jgi:serine phosphatase RsbU (regulator of sigma subunit)/tetratricopeptide (TPR) repeat protein
MKQFAGLLLCVFALGVRYGNAQNMNTDSLRKVIVASKADTAVIDALCELANISRKSSDNDSARIFAEDALHRSRQYHYRKGEAKAMYQIGVLISGKGELVEAMELFSEAMDIFDSLGERKQYASAALALGNQKMLLGDYPGALDYQLKALRIKQELGDSAALPSAYMSIGNSYHSSGDHEKAAKSFAHAIELDTMYGKRALIGTGYYNLGNVMFGMKKDSLGAKYLLNAIRIADARQDISLLCYTYGLLGQYNYRKGEYTAALDCHQRSLSLAEQLEDQRMIISEQRFLGLGYQALNQNARGEEYLLNALKLAADSTLKESRAEVYLTLSDFYASEGRYKESRDYLLRFTALHDSLTNLDKSKDIMRKEMNFSFEKSRALDNAERLKNEAIYEEDRKRKMIIIYSAAAFIVLSLLFLGFVFNRYRVSQRQKALIAEQKSEVEKQKSLIEEKNKSITDSINYAKRIQSAILPAVNEFTEAFPESFVYYRPKDIVSGDFYWIASSESHTFYATADCTGHGVPGGFMSVLGASLLNDIVNEKGVTEPADILVMMRDRIILALRQKGETGENKDGMDMVLCRVDRSKRELVYAAANNPVWIMRKDGLHEFPADKQPVGIGIENPGKFRQHTVALEPGDVIYTFTDGYADQFGGPKGKKFKYAQLRTVLEAQRNAAMPEQELHLARVFDDWKGALEQVDDILVIGVRVV